MKTKKLPKPESVTLMAKRKATEQRRQRLAREFRNSLLAGLPSASVAVRALVDAAASCHVEINALGERFMRGRATPQENERLSLARGQLSRILRQLGLITGPPEPEEPAAGAALAEWQQKRRERKQEANNGIPAAIGARS